MDVALDRNIAAIPNAIVLNPIGAVIANVMQARDSPARAITLMN